MLLGAFGGQIPWAHSALAISLIRFAFFSKKIIIYLG
jgi:hypothetical protein